MKRSSSSFRLLTRMRKFNTMIALSKNGCMLGDSTPLMSILTLNQMQPTQNNVSSPESWKLLDEGPLESDGNRLTHQRIKGTYAYPVYSLS